jgi:MFS family permease
MPVVADQPKSQPAGLHAMLVLICVSAPSFMLQLDANIVAVSLPSISESLGATFAGIEWVITAYTLSFASLLLPAGALAESDRLGFIREIASGNLSGTGIAFAHSAELHTLALKSFADGYAALFATSAGFCFVAAVITWLLVRDSDTAPIAKRAPLQSPPGLRS